MSGQQMIAQALKELTINSIDMMNEAEDNHTMVVLSESVNILLDESVNHVIEWN